MKIRPILLISALLAGFSCLPAQAQSAADKMDMGPGLVPDNRGGPGSAPGARPPRDCSMSRKPARCEQPQKARTACQKKQGPAHKACRREQFKAK